MATPALIFDAVDTIQGPDLSIFIYESKVPHSFSYSCFSLGVYGRVHLQASTLSSAKIEAAREIRRALLGRISQYEAALDTARKQHAALAEAAEPAQ